MTITGQCVCGDLLVGSGAWTALSKEERSKLRASGITRGQGRGLCARCYERARQDGTLIDHERLTTPWEWRVEDYQNIKDELPVGASPRQRAQAAAERMGCDVDTVLLALKMCGVEP